MYSRQTLLPFLGHPRVFFQFTATMSFLFFSYFVIIIVSAASLCVKGDRGALVLLALLGAKNRAIIIVYKAIYLPIWIEERQNVLFVLHSGIEGKCGAPVPSAVFRAKFRHWKSLQRHSFAIGI